MTITDITDNSNQYYGLTEKNLFAYKYSTEQLDSYTNSKIGKIFTCKIYPFPQAKTDTTNRATRMRDILDHQTGYSVVIRDSNINCGWDVISVEDLFYIKDILKDMNNLHNIHYKQPKSFGGGYAYGDFKLTKYDMSVPNELYLTDSFSKEQQYEFLGYWNMLAHTVKFEGYGFYHTHIDALNELVSIARTISERKYDVLVAVEESSAYRKAHVKRCAYLNRWHMVENVVDQIKDLVV